MCPAPATSRSLAAGMAAAMRRLRAANLASCSPAISSAGAAIWPRSGHREGCAPAPMPRKLLASPAASLSNRWRCSAARTPTLAAAWQAGRDVSIHGWVYGLQDGLLSDLKCTVRGNRGG